MYEGQTVICQKIIEENWLEYLSWVKKCSDEELERSKKRMEALKDIDGVQPSISNLDAVQKADIGSYRYFDISIQGFWNWYVINKV
jgi:hypothetical protein